AVAASDIGRFKIRVDAVVELERATITGLWGPAAARAVERLTGAAPPAAGWRRIGGRMVAAVPFRLGGPERFIITGLDPDDVRAAGITRAG
ncbi:MAG: hypothetical protein GWN35_24635, partial [Actinobacteria bacterium]|nr:hypothetical protein [Actinomycetota bacterium]NIV89861.1 hypothetical protein [Actinomycetota bacterium]